MKGNILSYCSCIELKLILCTRISNFEKRYVDWFDKLGYMLILMISRTAVVLSVGNISNDLIFLWGYSGGLLNTCILYLLTKKTKDISIPERSGSVSQVFVLRQEDPVECQSVINPQDNIDRSRTKLNFLFENWNFITFYQSRCLNLM